MGEDRSGCPGPEGKHREREVRRAPGLAEGKPAPVRRKVRADGAADHGYGKRSERKAVSTVPAWQVPGALQPLANREADYIPCLVSVCSRREPRQRGGYPSNLLTSALVLDSNQPGAAHTAKALQGAGDGPPGEVST